MTYSTKGECIKSALKYSLKMNDLRLFCILCERGKMNEKKKRVYVYTHTHRLCSYYVSQL